MFYLLLIPLFAFNLANCMDQCCVDQYYANYQKEIADFQIVGSTNPNFEADFGSYIEAFKTQMKKFPQDLIDTHCYFDHLTESILIVFLPYKSNPQVTIKDIVYIIQKSGIKTDGFWYGCPGNNFLHYAAAFGSPEIIQIAAQLNPRQLNLVNISGVVPLETCLILNKNQDSHLRLFQLYAEQYEQNLLSGRAKLVCEQLFAEIPQTQN